jgi:hypothetical protein
MSASSKTKVKRLLNVLVAGGVALAGLSGTARADDKTPDPAEKSDKAKDAEKARADEKAKAADQAAKEKKEKEKKAADSDGGGVRGW